MSDIAIEVHNISKKYELGLIGGGTLMETLGNRLKKRSQNNGLDEKEFWALKDVSFEVKRGEVMGIIGKNGAGKSTLLKVISRITQPSSGHIKINGRVASLLEVGTGFHPELTGRENIFLNGSILGMTRKEIKSKFDEIVDFSGIEKFIDTPVKRYSSGMYVRLAFAVAAHLEPEILVIDEVLAVGDMEFQRKCLGKMNEVSHSGRTVLFVSHNMTAVQHLCSNGILLKKGEIFSEGSIENVVEDYFSNSSNHNEKPLAIENQKSKEWGGIFRISNLTICKENGLKGDIKMGDSIYINLEYQFIDVSLKKSFGIAFHFIDQKENKVTICNPIFYKQSFSNLNDNGNIICKIPNIPISPGEYFVDVWISIGGIYKDYLERVTKFKIVPGDFFQSGFIPKKDKRYQFLIQHEWSIK